MKIEINKITTEKSDGELLSVKKEIIDLGDVKSMRSWHKKGNENLIKGEIILLTMRDGEKIKINEAYESFVDRIGQENVIRLNGTSSEH